MTLKTGTSLIISYNSAPQKARRHKNWISSYIINFFCYDHCLSFNIPIFYVNIGVSCAYPFNNAGHPSNLPGFKSNLVFQIYDPTSLPHDLVTIRLSMVKTEQKYIRTVFEFIFFWTDFLTVSII